MRRSLLILSSIGALALAAVASAPGASFVVKKPVAVPGTYNPSNGVPLYFFVAPGGRKMLNVAMNITLTCTPGGGAIGDQTFNIPQIPIGINGSFGSKASQQGFIGGYPALYSYAFGGHLAKATKQHTATGAGTYREDVTYTNSAGVHVTCSSNVQPWTASRVGSIPTTPTLLRPGNYTGVSRTLTFTAAPGSITTVSIPVAMICAPGGGAVGDRTFNIPQIAVAPDGSFSSHGSQTGVFGGSTATFNYAFSGNFQGLNASNVGSAAGTLHEDVVFTDTAGVQHTCTTNTVPWTANRTS